MRITLPTADGGLAPYTLQGPGAFTPAPPGTKLNRIAYSAAHVVADPRAAIDPWLQCAVDWDTTIAYRVRLWKMGLGVAEAMDTAQRGMGLDLADLAGADPPQPRCREGRARRPRRLGLRHRPPRARSRDGRRRRDPRV